MVEGHPRNTGDLRHAVPLPRRGCVLVADDDEDLRGSIATALSGAGYEVIEAGTGLELLERLRLCASDARGIDVVVSDQQMPGRTGLEVLAELRAEDFEVRFVLMTALADRAILAEAFRLGVDAVFDKPFDLDDLLTAVLNLVSKSANESRRGESAETLA